jgi:DNA polymerase-3 subunit beta
MFTIRAKPLLNALAAVTQAIERRNTIPVLSNCLIAHDIGGIIVTGSDLDIQIDVKVETEAAGFDAFPAFTVQAGLLHEIARKLPGDAEVDFSMKEHDCIVKSGRSRFVLPVLPASDFPKISTGEFVASSKLDMKIFNAALAGVAFAISTEETRYYLNGVYLHPLAEGGIALVATDGHRLAKRELPYDLTGLPGIIIPRKTVGLISKIMEGEATFSGSAQKIRFESEKVTLTSKLIDGTFPDYTRVIPQAREKTAIVEAEVLAAALDRVITVTSEKGRAVRFAFGDGSLDLAVNNPDAGSAEDSMSYEGNLALQIGFNAKYMADALHSIGGETVEFALQEAGDPAVLRSVPEQPGALCVVMPMRV